MGPTTRRDLLDLMFCNDQEFICGKDIMDNVLFSDHSLCIIGTKILSNIYTTDIPLYNLLKATQAKWDLLNNRSSLVD